MSTVLTFRVEKCDMDFYGVVLKERVAIWAMVSEVAIYHGGKIRELASRCPGSREQATSGHIQLYQSKPGRRLSLQLVERRAGWFSRSALLLIKHGFLLHTALRSHS